MKLIYEIRMVPRLVRRFMRQRGGEEWGKRVRMQRWSCGSFPLRFLVSIRLSNVNRFQILSFCKLWLACVAGLM